MEQENIQQFEKKKFSQKPIDIIFWLWLFFPVGIYFMWRSKVWSYNTRVYLTIAFSIFTLIMMASGSGRKINDNQNNQNNTSIKNSSALLEQTNGNNNLALPDKFFGRYSNEIYGSFTLMKDGTFNNFDENNNLISGVWNIIDSQGSSDYDWNFKLKLTATAGSNSEKEAFDLLDFEVHVANSTNRPILILSAAGINSYYDMK